MCAHMCVGVCVHVCMCIRRGKQQAISRTRLGNRTLKRILVARQRSLDQYDKQERATGGPWSMISAQFWKVSSGSCGKSKMKGEERIKRLGSHGTDMTAIFSPAAHVHTPLFPG